MLPLFSWFGQMFNVSNVIATNDSFESHLRKTIWILKLNIQYDIIVQTHSFYNM